MKYNVGDKVRIKSIDWYNENKDEDGIVELSTHIFTPGMSQFCGKVVTIEDVFEDIDDNVVYYIEEIDYDWTDEMIECKMEEETYDFLKTDKPYPTKPKVEDFLDMFNDTITLPEGFIFRDQNGNIIDATKIVLEKKKPYPKTYEECCKIIHSDPKFYVDTHLYSGILETLYKLLICRDAYWKIAGEEMGLGKPWEPDGNAAYAITRNDGYIVHIETGGNDEVLEFPTAEMRDQFQNNFNKEIEICKNLL
jgi:hypothetical protein